MLRDEYEGIVVPTLLYCSEVWAASAEDRRRMGLLIMNCMRAIYGVSIMDIVRT
jgi:hypothetical protein